MKAHRDALYRKEDPQIYGLSYLKDSDTLLTPEMQIAIIESVEGYCNKCIPVEGITPDCMAAQQLLDYLLKKSDMDKLKAEYLNIYDRIRACNEKCGNGDVCGSAKMTFHDLKSDFRSLASQPSNNNCPPFETDRPIRLEDVAKSTPDIASEIAPQSTLTPEIIGQEIKSLYSEIEDLKQLIAPEGTLTPEVTGPGGTGVTITLNNTEYTNLTDLEEPQAPQKTKEFWDPGVGWPHVDGGHLPKNNK
ncbi:MAG: hypothetical protein KAH93_01690 [Candidatus Aenigmarchaeota archaeon]|nr:hypothetical protein [Candidatus Aenigmarchaeota archaeon]